MALSRRAARALHLALFLIGVVLCILFILPRWWVLTGDIPATLATAGRIATAFPIALAGLPVLQILRGSLSTKPPTEIALRLRAWSAVLHAVAGVLILLAAIAEFWLSLETGPVAVRRLRRPPGDRDPGVPRAVSVLRRRKPPATPKPPKPKKVKGGEGHGDQETTPKKPRGKRRDAKPAEPTGLTETEATAAVVVEEADVAVRVGCGRRAGTHARRHRGCAGTGHRGGAACGGQPSEDQRARRLMRPSPRRPGPCATGDRPVSVAVAWAAEPLPRSRVKVTSRQRCE